MAERSTNETLATALIALGVVAGIVSLFYLPFGIAPVGFLAVLIGTAASSNRRNGSIATIFVVACFVIGAAVAVWNSSSLY